MFQLWERGLNTRRRRRSLDWNRRKKSLQVGRTRKRHGNFTTLRSGVCNVFESSGKKSLTFPSPFPVDGKEKVKINLKLHINGFHCFFLKGAFVMFMIEPTSFDFLKRK